MLRSRWLTGNFLVAATEFNAAIQANVRIKEGTVMSLDHDLDEISDVRLPVELLRLLSQMTSEFEARIRRQACRRAVAKSGDRRCVLGREDLVESIQAVFRDGSSEWLSAFTPNESTHVRRAS